MQLLDEPLSVAGRFCMIERNRLSGHTYLANKTILKVSCKWRHVPDVQHSYGPLPQEWNSSQCPKPQVEATSLEFQSSKVDLCHARKTLSFNK